MIPDDDKVRRIVKNILLQAGFAVRTAKDGVAGLQVFLDLSDEIDLVLADNVMPVMDGIRMAEEIKKKRPEVPVLLMTGCFSPDVTAALNERFPLIRKPFSPDGLRGRHPRNRNGSRSPFR